jgi:fructoselysine 6-kinase
MKSMDICVIGDNCIDIIKEESEFEYPGGNGVNTSVALSRLGNSVSFVGVVGNDDRGMTVRENLINEDVDISRLKVAEGRTAWTEIQLEKGERKFVDEDLGVQQSFELDQDDFDYLSKFGWVHHTGFTNWTSAFEGNSNRFFIGIANQISNIIKEVPGVSVDFSNVNYREFLSSIGNRVGIGFFSRDRMNYQEAQAEIQSIEKQYFDDIVITMGEYGSYGFNGQYLTYQCSDSVNVVSTLGAGDAFIGAYLDAFLQNQRQSDCLEAGSKYAGKVCESISAF